MATRPQLAQKLRSGETVFASWHTSANPDLVSMAAQSGMGCIVLDVQHGAYGYETMAQAVPRALLFGAAAAVRLAAHDYAFAGRAVDAGVEAVIAPMIETAQDAADLVQAVKYLPQGLRSWGPATAMAYHGVEAAQDQLENANDWVLAFAMIETQSAVDNLEDILAVDGLDGVFVGPSDLSVALTNGSKIDPFGEASMPVIEMIAEKSRAADKIPAIFTTKAEDAKTARQLGYRLISLTTDQGAFAVGIGSAIASAS